MSDPVHRLQQHIFKLCQNDRAPQSEGYRNSQRYLREQIHSLGLKVQEQTFKAWGLGECLNIFAEAGDPTKPRVLIGAHYETRDVSGPGADDNASAVAVALEVLRTLKDSKDIAITVVFFDMEENWKWSSLRGSRAFARWYSKPLSKVIILDLVGGALTPEFEPTYLQFGSALKALEHPQLEFLHMPLIVLEPIGTLGARSDYDEFRKMKVPFTFFSSGTPWYYHTPFDTIEVLRWEKMAFFTEALIEGIQQAPAAQTFEAPWSNFSRFIAKFSANPLIANDRITRIAQKSKPPTRWEIIRLYMDVLPKLRRLGPELWDMARTEHRSVQRH